MLTIKRKPGQSIGIGRVGDYPAKITLVKIDRNCVYLAFDSPDDIRIVRSELTIPVAEKKRKSPQLHCGLRGTRPKKLDQTAGSP